MKLSDIDTAFQTLDHNNYLSSQRDWYENCRRVAVAVDENICRRPLLIQYTNHDLGHLLEVIKIAGRMTASLSTPLNSSELYIFAMAALLHDIGMYCMMPKVLKNHGIELKNTSWEEAEKLRPVHELLTVDMIKGYFTEPSVFPNLELPPLFRGEIMKVAKAHRRDHWKDLDEEAFVDNGDRVRLKFLGTLLNIADEFHKSANRVNFEDFKRLALPLKSKIYWLSHYMVRTIVIEKNGAITMVYLIPKDFEDATEFLVHGVEGQLNKKIDDFRSLHVPEGITLVFKDKRQIEIDSAPLIVKPDPGEWQALLESFKAVVGEQSVEPPPAAKEPVGLFVDAESTTIEFLKRGITNQVMTAEQFAPSITRYAKRFGDPKSCRIYGHWSRNQKAQQYNEYGLQPVERNEQSAEDQITTDIKKCIEAKEAKTVIIVTGKDKYSEVLSTARTSSDCRTVYLPVDTESTKASSTVASESAGLYDALGIHDVKSTPMDRNEWNKKLQSWAIWLNNFRFEQGYRWFSFSKLRDLAQQQIDHDVDPRQEIDILLGEGILQHRKDREGRAIFVLNDANAAVIGTQNAQRDIIWALFNLSGDSENEINTEALRSELRGYRLDKSGFDTQGWLKLLESERILKMGSDTVTLNFGHPVVVLESKASELTALTLLVERETQAARNTRGAKKDKSPTQINLESILSDTFIGNDAGRIIGLAKNLKMFRQISNNSDPGALPVLDYFNGPVQCCNDIGSLLIKVVATTLRKQGKQPGKPASLNLEKIAETLSEHRVFGRRDDEYHKWIRMLVDIEVLKALDDTDNQLILDENSVLVAQALYTDALAMKLIQRSGAGNKPVLEFELAKSIRAPRKIVFEAIHAGRHHGLFWTAKRKKGEPVRLLLNPKHAITQQTRELYDRTADAILGYLSDPAIASQGATFWQLHRALDFLPAEWDRSFWINELADQVKILRQKVTIGDKQKTLFTAKSPDSPPAAQKQRALLRKAA